jgi:hypothetical protein
MVDLTVLPGYVAAILLFLGPPPGPTWPTCSRWASKAVAGPR